MFVYYSYFGRARAGQIKLIEDDVQRIAELDERARRRRTRKLAELEKQQRAQLRELEQAREKRSHVLASLEAQSHTRAQNLERLKSQQAGLEKLLRELRAAHRAFPGRGQRCLHAPARQARLAGERAARGALRRVARRRGALGRGAGGHRARHAGQGGVRRAGSSTPTGSRAWAADHRRPRRRLPEPLRPQRAPATRRSASRWPPGTPSRPPATPAAARARSCISRSARGASRSIRDPGSGLPTLRRSRREGLPARPAGRM